MAKRKPSNATPEPVSLTITQHRMLRIVNPHDHPVIITAQAVAKDYPHTLPEPFVLPVTGEFEVEADDAIRWTATKAGNAELADAGMPQETAAEPQATDADDATDPAADEAQS